MGVGYGSIRGWGASVDIFSSTHLLVQHVRIAHLWVGKGRKCIVGKVEVGDTAVIAAPALVVWVGLRHTRH